MFDGKLCSRTKTVYDYIGDHLGYRLELTSEKDANLAQKLGQLQHFIVVFPQECMGQLGSFGPT